MLDATAQALTFLTPLITPQGVYFGRYRNGSLIANPRLIAGAGDVLRAMVSGQKLGIGSEKEIQDLATLLSDQQLPSGGIPTSYGFAWRGRRQPYKGLPEFRDILPVVGWCDKALRALSTLNLDANFSLPRIDATEINCKWKGKVYKAFENASTVALSDLARKNFIFSWQKRAAYPETFRL